MTTEGTIFDVDDQLLQSPTEVVLAPDGSWGQLLVEEDNVPRLSTSQPYRLVLADGQERRILFSRIKQSELAVATAAFIASEPFAPRVR